MPFPVRVIFTDLCAYLARPGVGLDVLLVNALGPNPDQEKAGMGAHTPLIAVRTKSLYRGPDARAEDKLVPELGGDTLSLFHLSFEEVRFVTSSPLDLVSYPINSAVPSCRQERESLAWIARLDSLGFAPEVLDPACEGDLSPGGRVAARVQIRGGRVTCLRVFAEPDPWRQFDLRVSPDRSPVGGAPQAFADLVAVTMEFPTLEENGGPQIASTSGSGIGLLPPLDGERLDLLVGNISTETGLDSSPDVASHFRWFYELLKRPPALFERPIPHAVAQGPLTSSNGPCFHGGIGMP